MVKKVAIVGSGEVGSNLVKALSKEDYEITVIEENVHKCKRINEKYDVSVIEGDGASQRILQQIEMESFDYFFALTSLVIIIFCDLSLSAASSLLSASI